MFTRQLKKVEMNTENLGNESGDRETEHDWTPCAQRLPADGVEVLTKIDDDKGVRNEQGLVRRGSLWFTGTSGDAMYVYYAPTHWKPLEFAKRPVSDDQQHGQAS